MRNASENQKSVSNSANNRAALPPPTHCVPVGIVPRPPAGRRYSQQTRNVWPKPANYRTRPMESERVNNMFTH